MFVRWLQAFRLRISFLRIRIYMLLKIGKVMNIEQINSLIEPLHLLKHPFYQLWSAGGLNQEILKEYSAQYFHHVDAFPRYISYIHSTCTDLKSRQVLLGNLMDEENGEENHPELWLRFAEELGASREYVKSAELNAETKALVEGFFAICAKGYSYGIGAFYAYEQQVPEIAKSKIDGLKKFYDITSAKAHQFFEVHIHADEWHSAEVAKLIENLPESQRKEAAEGALEARKLLWGFLDGMMPMCGSNVN